MAKPKKSKKSPDKAPEKEEVKRRKPDEDRREEQIHIRVSEAEKAELVDGAKRLGLGMDVSGWLRWLGLRESRGATPPAVPAPSVPVAAPAKAPQQAQKDEK